MNNLTVKFTWFKAGESFPRKGERVLVTEPSCDVVDFARCYDKKFYNVDDEEFEVELWAQIPYVPTTEELLDVHSKSEVQGD